MCRWGKQYLDLARSRIDALDPWLPCSEPISQRRIAKKGGGYRHVNAYGPQMVAKQRAVKRVLKEAWCSDFQLQRQYCGGQIGLVADLRSTLQANRPSVCAVMDIANCFGSVKREYLFQFLPLPDEVIENTVLAEAPDNVAETAEGTQRVKSKTQLLETPSATQPSHKAHQGNGRRGLPQGSACSPIIAYHLLETAIRPTVDAQDCFQWADDILLLGSSVGEIRAKMTALQLALERHPAGPFLVGRQAIFMMPGDFDYLGLTFSHAPGRKVDIRTSVEAWDRFLARADSYAALELRGGGNDIYRSVNYMRALRRASLADDADRRFFTAFLQVCERHGLEI